MSVVFSTRARWRGKRPLLALLQGLFTVALTLLGLLLITFALSALSPSIAYYKSLAITPASPPMIRYATS